MTFLILLSSINCTLHYYQLSYFIRFTGVITGSSLTSVPVYQNRTEIVLRHCDRTEWEMVTDWFSREIKQNTPQCPRQIYKEGTLKVSVTVCPDLMRVWFISPQRRTVHESSVLTCCHWSSWHQHCPGHKGQVWSHDPAGCQKPSSRLHTEAFWRCSQKSMNFNTEPWQGGRSWQRASLSRSLPALLIWCSTTFALSYLLCSALLCLGLNPLSAKGPARETKLHHGSIPSMCPFPRGCSYCIPYIMD